MKPTIAVDLAKSVFEIAVSRHPGKVAERYRLSRARLVRFFAKRELATVLLEACSSAHFWARELEKLGHQVVLLPPHLVRPYRRRHHKTDRADAKALLEAFRNAEIHPVPAKSVEQQTLASLHRLRSAWLATRTASINAVRGILRELGFTIPQGAAHVVPRVRELVDDAEQPLPEALRLTLTEACSRRPVQPTADSPSAPRGPCCLTAHSSAALPAASWLKRLIEKFTAKVYQWCRRARAASAAVMEWTPPAT